MKKTTVLYFSILACLLVSWNAFGDSTGKADYLANCARCHGTDGKGAVPEMRAVPGYVSVDLTQLTKANGNHFPRQQVYDAIDGRQRFRDHFLGDMPVWGLEFQRNNNVESEKRNGLRISEIVDYIESIQEK